MKVLILCTGNSCRSQIAEAWFIYYAEKLNLSVKPFSAGISPKGIHPMAILVMNEAGIDISKQKSESVQNYINISFDFIITVCDKAAINCPVFSGAREKIHWPFDDPAVFTGTENEILIEFRRVRDLIGKKSIIGSKKINQKESAENQPRYFA